MTKPKPSLSEIGASIRPLEYGPSLRFMITITLMGKDGYERETMSISKSTYKIYNLAEVKFKYESVEVDTKDDYDIVIKLSYSARKLGSDINSVVRPKFICQSLSYSRLLLCSHEWSDWQFIGQVTTDFVEPSSIFQAHYDLYVSVFEEKANTMSLKLYHDTEFTDFCLSTTAGELVNVHKACLATHSDVFKTMLTGEWKETTEGKIKLEGVTKCTLQHLKDYIYLGTLPNDEGLRPLLLVARCYMMEHLEEQCIRRLAEAVTSEDLFSLMEFACYNNLPELVFAVTMLTHDWTKHKAYHLRKKELVALREANNNNF